MPDTLGPRADAMLDLHWDGPDGHELRFSIHPHVLHVRIARDHPGAPSPGAQR